LGDVRLLQLQAALHASVALQRASDATPTAQLRQLLQQRLRQDAELLLDPGFFRELVSAHPRLRSARVLLHTGRSDDELTRFRADVLLAGSRHLAAPPRRAADGAPASVRAE